MAKGKPLTGAVTIGPQKPIPASYGQFSLSNPSINARQAQRAVSGGLMFDIVAEYVRDMTNGRGLRAVWLTDGVIEKMVEAMNLLHEQAGDGIVVTWQWGKEGVDGFFEPVFSEHVVTHVPEVQTDHPPMLERRGF